MTKCSRVCCCVPKCYCYCREMPDAGKFSMTGAGKSEVIYCGFVFVNLSLLAEMISLRFFVLRETANCSLFSILSLVDMFMDIMAELLLLSFDMDENGVNLLTVDYSCICCRWFC